MIDIGHFDKQCTFPFRLYHSISHIQLYENTFRIEKILRRMRKTDGTRLARVKWVGYDSSYNSWIPESEIIKYGNH